MVIVRVVFINRLQRYTLFPELVFLFVKSFQQFKTFFYPGFNLIKYHSYFFLNFLSRLFLLFSVLKKFV